MAAIDRVCMDDADFGTFDPHIIRDLCKRGLIYFEVPVYPHDRFKGLFYGFMFSYIF